MPPARWVRATAALAFGLAAACASVPPAPVARAPRAQPPPLASASRPAGFYPGDPLPPRTAYLTFDDGPAPWTAGVLDALREGGVHATFFVDNAGIPAGVSGFAGFDAVVRRIVEEGHALGNHTHNHPDLGPLPAAEIAHELDANQAAVDRALGGPSRRLRLIRPSFGSPWMTATSGAGVVGPVIAERGLNVLWSLDSGDALDWVRGERYAADAEYDPSTPEYQAKVRRIEDAVLGPLRGQGAIILFHDTHPTTRDVLPAILAGLKAKAYQTATLDEWMTWRHPAAR